MPMVLVYMVIRWSQWRSARDVVVGRIAIGLHYRCEYNVFMRSSTPILVSDSWAKFMTLERLCGYVT